MDIVTIGEKLNISERSVINAINELEKNKIIIRTKHPNDKRRNDFFKSFYFLERKCWVKKKMIEIIPANQLDLFGISEEDHKIREKNEIKNGVQLIENQTNIIDQIKELEDK